jgi:hypothetical protein
MKITGRNIKRRLYGLRSLGRNIKRARHFRGHGVHSPFVYSVVRQVFMPSTFIGDKRDLYEALTARYIAQRRARELQNLMEHCRYESFGIDSAIDQFELYDIIIATTSIEPEQLETMAKAAVAAGKTLCIMSPMLDGPRDKACRRIVDEHRCTSIDNRGYLLLFNNHLPKQKFRL